MAPRTIVETLQEHAQTRPQAPAFSYLELGSIPAGTLTFAQLDAQARAGAGTLRQRLPAGARALLIHPEGLEFVKAFFGALYAGLIPAPVPAPDLTRLKRTLPRLAAVARDTQAAALLSTGPLLQDLQASLGSTPGLERLEGLATDGWAAAGAPPGTPPPLPPDALAYLQYTSGSTVDPKGVMITHANIMAHCRQLQAGYGVSERSIFLTWLPHTHDYGLVEGILLPAFLGAHSYLMSPRAFLRRPHCWLEAIGKYRVTHSQGPNFAYEYCLRRITPAQRAGLELSCWRTASVGAEPVRVTALERFQRIFAPCGLRADTLAPSYGLAESTLVVTTAHRPRAVGHLHAAEAHPEASPHGLANCGQALPGVRLEIVDPATLRPCPPATVGEIWVHSAAVALGYWRQPEASAATFGARLAPSGEGPFLRTGDLGFLKQGELFITGRLKDVIIIRGANHYPQDIERTCEQSHPGFRPNCSAAFGLEQREGSAVAVVAEVERGTASERHPELLRAACQAISEHHELPIAALVLSPPGSVPKTTSGKIQRATCRNLLLGGALPILAVWPPNPAWAGPRPVEALERFLGTDSEPGSPALPTLETEAWEGR